MAGAKFHFDLTPADDENAPPIRVVARLRDVSLWERTISNRSLAGLERHGRLSELEELALFAARRLKLFDGNLATFRERYDIEPVDPNADKPAGAETDQEGDEGEDPTRSGP